MASRMARFSTASAAETLAAGGESGNLMVSDSVTFRPAQTDKREPEVLSNTTERAGGRSGVRGGWGGGSYLMLVKNVGIICIMLRRTVS